MKESGLDFGGFDTLGILWGSERSMKSIRPVLRLRPHSEPSDRCSVDEVWALGVEKPSSTGDLYRVDVVARGTAGEFVCIGSVAALKCWTLS